MATPSAAGSHKDTLDSAWDRFFKTLGVVKVQSQRFIDRSAVGPVVAEEIATYAGQLANWVDDLTAIAALPGIGDYAQAQISNPALDLAVEWPLTLAQINATRTWIVSNFPKDASGYWQIAQFDGAGRRVVRSFSSADLAGFRTVLGALVATID